MENRVAGCESAFRWRPATAPFPPIGDDVVFHDERATDGHSGTSATEGVGDADVGDWLIGLLLHRPCLAECAAL